MRCPDGGGGREEEERRREDPSGEGDRVPTVEAGERWKGGAVRDLLGCRGSFHRFSRKRDAPVRQPFWRKLGKDKS